MRRGRKARGLPRGDGSAAGLPTSSSCNPAMNATLSRASRLLCATTLALVLLAAPAYADAPFAPRFAQTLRGDIAAVGQHADDLPGRAPPAPPHRAAAQRQQQRLHDGLRRRRRRRDHTSTPRRPPSSLARPAPTVVWAGLYWAGDTTAGTSGAPPDAREPRHGAPQGPGRRLPDASRPRRPTSSPPARSPSATAAFRDVTALVAAAGSGTLHGGERPGRHGHRPLRRLGAVRRLPRHAAGGPRPARVRRARHGRRQRTPSRRRSRRSTRRPPAPLTTKVGLLTFEGDAGLANETATFNDDALTDALNPARTTR